MRRRTTYLFTLILGLATLLVATSWAQTPNRAALVVRFDDERVETRCVSFTEETISGHELLQRSGLAIEVSEANLGVTVCRVEDVGCAASNCFCQCQGASCRYWSYWHLQNDTWRYSNVGAHAYQVGDGDVEGWTWGPGSANEAKPPPVLVFDEICTKTMTGTPTVLSTVTEVTTSTSEPEQDVAPSATPTNEATTAGGGGTWVYGVFGIIVLLLAVAMGVARRQRP